MAEAKVPAGPSAPTTPEFESWWSVDAMREAHQWASSWVQNTVLADAESSDGIKMQTKQTAGTMHAQDQATAARQSADISQVNTTQSA